MERLKLRWKLIKLTARKIYAVLRGQHDQFITLFKESQAVHAQLGHQTIDVDAEVARWQREGY